MGKTIQVSGFPNVLAADVVKGFLEEYSGEGTVYALEVKQYKAGRRAFAKVQFTNRRSTELIIEKAKRGLHFGSSYLRAYEENLDMVPRPRSFVHEMEQVVLNFGCQVSKNKFAVLWKKANVSVKFGIGMKKMYFMLQFDSLDYKLELSYQNFWKIVLHHPHSQASKFLLIQLFGAPRIFKLVEGSKCSYLKETPDDQWVRTTDFTTSCIGQSSGICLELPLGVQLPNFSDYFAWYEKNESQFTLETRSP